MEGLEGRGRHSRECPNPGRLRSLALSCRKGKPFEGEFLRARGGCWEQLPDP